MSFDFRFKHFGVNHGRCGMKVGTDGVLLGAWADSAGARRVLDVGCGCGLIALMIAQRNADCHITAIDLDCGAVADATDNVASTPWSGRIDVHQADFGDFHPVSDFDLIVSNPPFFLTGEHATDAKRGNARHAGVLSPTGLMDFASQYLSEVGTLAIIAPAGQYSDLLFYATLKHLYPQRVTHVYSVEGKPEPIRTLWQLSKMSCKCDESNLYIRVAGGEYTSDFKELTSDFYL